MEIVTSIDQEQGIRIHTVSGRLCKDKLFPKLNEIYASPEFRDDMNVLWDLRDADSKSVIMSDIVKIRDFIVGKWKDGATILVAAVVGTEVDFGLLTMFEVLLQGKERFRIQIFRRMEDALYWLNR